MKLARRKTASEHGIQAQLFNELAYKQHPDVIIVAIPNGGLRHALVAISLKAEGVRPGTPDIVACLREGRAGWLEMKARKGALRDEQVGFKTKVLKLGHYWGLARTVDEALAHLRSWGALREGC